MRWLYYTIIAGLISACVIMLYLGLQNNRSQGQQANSTPPNASKTQSDNPVDVVTSSNANTTTSSRTTSSYVNTSDITMSNVLKIENNGGSRVIVLRDGRKVYANPQMIENLPGDVALRLNYSRDH